MERKVDLLIEILYCMEEPRTSIIRTNIKAERLDDILGDYLCGQIGKGKDNSKPNKKDVYKISIGVDLSCDTFYTSSDTGNAGLTCGIVMQVRELLDKLEILPLVSEYKN